MNKQQDIFLKNLFGTRLESIKRTFGKEAKTIDDFFLFDENLIKLFDICEFKGDLQIQKLRFSRNSIFTNEFFSLTRNYFNHTLKSWKEKGNNFKDFAQELYNKKFLIPKSVMIGIFLYDEPITVDEFVAFFFNSFTCYPFLYSLHIPKSLIPHSLKIYALLNKLYKYTFTQFQEKTSA